MNQKITIIELVIKNGWVNTKTKDGQEISINVESNPESTKKLNEGTICPIEIELNIVEKNGKKYGWDIKPEGQKKPNPFFKSPEEIKAKQEGYEHTQRTIIAQSSLSASSRFYAGRSGVDAQSVIDTAEMFYNWVTKISR